MEEKKNIMRSLTVLEGKIQHYLNDTLTYEDAVQIFPNWKPAKHGDHPAKDPLSFYPETSGNRERDYKDNKYLNALLEFFNMYLDQLALQAKQKGHKHYSLYEMLSSAADLTIQLMK